MIRERDGILHVCARQSEVIWARLTSDPIVQDACAQVCIKTRLCLNMCEIEQELVSCFQKVLSDALSPFLSDTERESHLSLPLTSVLAP
jgi:hypothetical protein